MSLKQRPERRYSWKKPWAFDTLHHMRATITEREVYRKLKLLERHSRLKKPYYNLRSHPFGELVFSPPSPPPWKIDPPPPPPPVEDNNYPVSPTDCPIACLPTSLNCDGDCSEIVCICAEGGGISSINDPTGGMVTIGPGELKANTAISVGGISLPGTHFPICLAPGYTNDEEYPTIIVSISGANGSVSHVEVPIVNCSWCCTEPAVSGPTTATQSSTAEFAVSPPCPHASVSCAGDCDDITVELNQAGSKVTATLGAVACGTFYVTVTEAAWCPAWSVDSNKCRITDGGDWDVDNFTECNPGPTPCSTLCANPCNVQDLNNLLECDAICYKYDFWCLPSSTCTTATDLCKPPCANPPARCQGEATCHCHYESVEWTCDGDRGAGTWC